VSASDNRTEKKRSYGEVANDIVEAILDDLQDRSGLQNAWDDCDADIQDEIREKWRELVLQAMGVET